MEVDVLLVLTNCIIVTVVVVIHYELLRRISTLLPRMTILYNLRIAVGVIGVLIAHAIEVWVFALSYYLMVKAGGGGTFEGNFQGTIGDCAYFSFTTFTTLGFGDIVPFGPIRYLTGIESLTGLVLITWSASYLYFEMQRFWEFQDKR
jgi:hypothetical protein